MWLRFMRHMDTSYMSLCHLLVTRGLISTAVVCQSLDCLPPSLAHPLTPLRRENRLRLALEIITITRNAFPKYKPVFLRISATDYHSAGEKNSSGEYISWGLEQSAVLLKEAVARGVDLLDVSSGGNDSEQTIAVGPAYQVSNSCFVGTEVTLTFVRDRFHLRSSYANPYQRAARSQYLPWE